MQKWIIAGLICFLAAPGTVDSLRAQGTAFTYQGQLNDGGNPAGGSYDLTFSLYSSTNLPGTILAGPITNSAVSVANGLFATTLDFGSGVFAGTNYWLQIGVRTNGGTAFTTLSPRQPLTPTPYAIFANTASNLSGTLPSTQLSGALPSAQISGIYSGAVTFNNSANSFLGVFAGNGANLSNLNASQLITGTVADTRLSSNVALLNANQTFTGANTFTGTDTFNGVNTFTNPANSFRGSFFGNGLVGWLVPTGTTVQAVEDTGYLLTNSQLVTVVLPTIHNMGDIIRISCSGTGGWKISQNSSQSILGNFLSYLNSYWTSLLTSDYWQSLAMSADGNKVVASTLAKGIFLISGGASSYLGSNLPGAADVAASADCNELVAVTGGSSGSIYLYNYSANNWVQPAGAPTGNFTAVASSADGTRMVAVTSNSVSGTIYVSTNSGANWTATASGQKWVSVATSADGTKMLAAAYGNYLYLSANSGSSWTPNTFGSANWTAVASSADGSKLAAANGSGYIYTSGDAGANWQQSGAPSANWSGLASSADGAKLTAAIRGGGIYLSSNFGVTWTKSAGAPTQNWDSIASSADGTRLAASVYATSSGVYTSQASMQTSSTTGTNGFISGGQGTAVELQYYGSAKFMPVSSAGTIWAN